MGLSPQVRGNQIRSVLSATFPGSIPAGAGEPFQFSDAGRINQVYPRRCGGTFCRFFHVVSPVGLSPQVRGNPKDTTFTINGNGSIPAGAGEPCSVS